MRKQSGFTLIEMMATLGILAIIALIAVPTINSLMGDAADDSDAASVAMIERAAKASRMSNGPNDPNMDIGGEAYSVKSLVDAGYAQYDYEAPGALEGIVQMTDAGIYQYTGRQMLKDYKASHQSVWGSDSSRMTREVLDDSVRLTSTTNNSNAYQWVHNRLVPGQSIEPGKTYTVSVDVKGDVDDLRFGLRGSVSPEGPMETFYPTHTVTPNDGWKRISTTFMFEREPGAMLVLFRMFAPGETIEFKNLQIEPGAKANPAGYAKEDLM